MAGLPPVSEQMEAIRADAVEIVPEDELERKLERSRERGEPLTVKQGFDPTRPDLHIGHAVSLRALRTFQELGHQVVFVVGDYTARVGDPSGRSETRPRLSAEEIDEHARTYAEQADAILDVSRARVAYNSEWLAPLDLAELLELASCSTVARMLEREDFSARYADGRAISIVEFLYPLLQAYDSVALDADIEVGGTDQKFNLLMGRTVQRRYGREPQVCLLLPLLVGTDGERKMSKSRGNAIGLAESAEDQFGKAMSIPDALLEEWYRLATPLEGDALDDALARAADDPYAAKRDLARLLARTYHGEERAESAERHFDRVVRRRERPEDIPDREVDLAADALRWEPGGGVWLPGLLKQTELARSNSAATRLIEQGAIRVDGERVEDRNTRVPAEPGGEVVLRRGKRTFLRARFRGS